MKKVGEVFKNGINDVEMDPAVKGHLNYDKILSNFGTILIKQVDDAHTGDTRVLIEKDGKYGYLKFAWGSTIDNDSIRACKDMVNLKNLMDEMYSKIKWFENKIIAKAFFDGYQWDRDKDWERQGQKDFIFNSKSYLGK